MAASDDDVGLFRLTHASRLSSSILRAPGPSAFERKVVQLVAKMKARSNRLGYSHLALFPGALCKLDTSNRSVKRRGELESCIPQRKNMLTDLELVLPVA